jgi:hypothetical protein
MALPDPLVKIIVRYIFTDFTYEISYQKISLETFQWYADMLYMSLIYKNHIDMGVLFRNSLYSENILNSQWVQETFDLDKHHCVNFTTLNLCIFTNQLETLKWLHKKFELNKGIISESMCKSIISCAICYDNLEILKWLENTFKITDRSYVIDIFFWTTCYYNKLEIMKWVLKKFQLSREEVLTSNTTIALTNNLEVYKWIKNEFKFTNGEIVIKDRNYIPDDITIEFMKWISDNCTVEGGALETRLRLLKANGAI